MERALEQWNRRVEIRGFRRGKAPKTLLERYVGKDTIYEEAVKLLVPDAYSQAIQQSGMHPIAQPEIQVQAVEEGKPLRFVATVDLVPDVRLGDYRAIRRGKAPKTLLERYVGKDTIYEEAVKLLVPDAYSQAIQQSGMHPIAQPEIQVQAVEEGKPLRFVATVDLVPDVRLGDYRAIRAER